MQETFSTFLIGIFILKNVIKINLTFDIKNVMPIKEGKENGMWHFNKRGDSSISPCFIHIDLANLHNNNYFVAF